MTESQPPYAVRWAGPARRALERLPAKVACAVIEFVYGALASNPQRVGHALRFDLAGKHSARQGDYRVIFQIDDERQAVVIEVIDHRGDVYRRR